MEHKNDKDSLNLINDEEILYVPKKNYVEFLICFPLTVIISVFLFLYMYNIAVKVYSLWVSFLILLFIYLCYILYTYLRDFFFTKIILTNKRILIHRFNKPFSINYSEIKRIIYNYGKIGPSYFIMLLKPYRFYKINFIPSDKLREEIKKNNMEILLHQSEPIFFCIMLKEIQNLSSVAYWKDPETSSG